MEKIYCDEVYNPKTKEATDFCVGLYYAHTKVKEHFDEDDYKTWAFNFNNYIREMLNLPNKVVSIAKSVDNTQVQIVLFPKEPDGNLYEIFYDEELKLAYILIE